MRDTYLEYLCIYLKDGDKDSGLFRTFVDNWYAYEFGGKLLNRDGRPKWFNNPSPTANKEALMSMHYQSIDAVLAIEGRAESRIVKDHAIPLKVLRNLMMDIAEPNKVSINDFLHSYYRLGVITKNEDDQLNKLGLRSAMPTNWDRKDWKARYLELGI